MKIHKKQQQHKKGDEGVLVGQYHSVKTTATVTATAQAATTTATGY
jgi:hypothetical protein